MPATKKQPLFSKGDIVFAKVRGYPAWPALILDREQGMTISGPKKQSHFVRFYQSSDHAWVLEKEMHEFQSRLDEAIETCSKRSTKQFKDLKIAIDLAYKDFKEVAASGRSNLLLPETLGNEDRLDQNIGNGNVSNDKQKKASAGEKDSSKKGKSKHKKHKSSKRPHSDTEEKEQRKTKSSKTKPAPRQSRKIGIIGMVPLNAQETLADAGHELVAAPIAAQDVQDIKCIPNVVKESSPEHLFQQTDCVIMSFQGSDLWEKEFKPLLRRAVVPDTNFQGIVIIGNLDMRAAAELEDIAQSKRVGLAAMDNLEGSDAFYPVYVKGEKMVSMVSEICGREVNINNYTSLSNGYKLFQAINRLHVETNFFWMEQAKNISAQIPNLSQEEFISEAASALPLTQTVHTSRQLQGNDTAWFNNYLTCCQTQSGSVKFASDMISNYIKLSVEDSKNRRNESLRIQETESSCIVDDDIEEEENSLVNCVDTSSAQEPTTGNNALANGYSGEQRMDDNIDQN